MNRPLIHRCVPPRKVPPSHYGQWPLLFAAAHLSIQPHRVFLPDVRRHVSQDMRPKLKRPPPPKPNTTTSAHQHNVIEPISSQSPETKPKFNWKQPLALLSRRTKYTILLVVTALALLELALYIKMGWRMYREGTTLDPRKDRQRGKFRSD